MARTKTQVKKKVQKELTKEIKKTNPILILLIIIFFALGAGLGVFANYYVSKNDEFVVLGEKEITLNIGDAYIEEGAKAISFGKDVSNDIEIVGTVDITTAGVYEIVYKCSNLKYKDIIRVRTVTVLEVEA